MKNPIIEPIRDRAKWCNPQDLTSQKLQAALDEALRVIDADIVEFDGLFPAEFGVNNHYETWENDRGWGQGFWPGMLWIAYELTGNQKYADAANALVPSFLKRIDEFIGVAHHDMGFLYTPSCVAAYKLTGNEMAKEAALKAADNLIGRYHEKGQFIQAWGELDKQDSYRLIIDCLLNIPLLYWASEVTGDNKYAEIAFNHYNATADNIVREDGSTFHTYYFDMETGEPTKGVTAQGFSDDSCWARGQAWGIYGFMLTYMYKKNPDAIPLFKSVTNYFLNRMPADSVAYWDISFNDGSGEERDSSSAAIAACGLIEGAKALSDDDPDKELYINAAKQMMNSLIDGYTSKGTDSNGLLLHAVYTKPGNIGVDDLNIWGDYFYMEALGRLIKGQDFKAYW